MAVSNRNTTTPYTGSPSGVPDIVTQTLQGFNTVLPGLSGNLATASGNIAGDLKGMASPDIVRNANAYFGANSGMPGSEFVRNRGFDLFQQEGDARKQRGQKDLIALLGGVSGNLTPTAGQNLGAKTAADQLGLGYANLGEGSRQFDQNMAFQRWLKAQELGLSGARLGIDAAQGGAGLLGSYLNFLN